MTLTSPATVKNASTTQSTSIPENADSQYHLSFFVEGVGSCADVRKVSAPPQTVQLEGETVGDESPTDPGEKMVPHFAH